MGDGGRGSHSGLSGVQKIEREESVNCTARGFDGAESCPTAG